MAVATYTKSGTKVTVAAKLDKQVFGVATTNHELLKRAYITYLANGRLNLAVTKTRGLVSGGGKKPWKQKGTGRARFGSSRNPIWRGGGIAFGPTGNENYALKLPTSTKRAAIRQALTLAVGSDKLIVIEDLSFKDAKSAEAARLFKKIGIIKKALVVVEQTNSDLSRATDNLPNISLVSAAYLNVYDILNADHIVITTDALKLVTKNLSTPKSAAKKEEA